MTRKGSWKKLKRQLKKDMSSPRMKVNFNAGCRVPVGIKVYTILNLMAQKKWINRHWPDKALRVKQKQCKKEN